MCMAEAADIAIYATYNPFRMNIDFKILVLAFKAQNGLVPDISLSCSL